MTIKFNTDNETWWDLTKTSTRLYQGHVHTEPATEADLRAAGYIPIAERNTLAAQVSQMQAALDECREDHMHDRAEWREERDALAAQVAQMREAVQRIHDLDAAWRHITGPALRALDGKDGADDE